MEIHKFFSSILLLIQISLSAQVNSINVKAPEADDFQGILKFLSSGWMEGREAGEKGGFIASDYIASMMQFIKLVPYSQMNDLNLKPNRHQGFFQDFELISYKVENSELTIIQRDAGFQSYHNLYKGLDYQVNAIPDGIEAESSIVFMGYGISSAEKGIDDYKGIDVKNKIVLVLSGFHGCKDTNSIAYKRFGKLFTDEETMEKKQNIAKQHGAIALIVINTVYDTTFRPENMDIVESSMNQGIIQEPVYEDAEYMLPSDLTDAPIPLFLVNRSAGMEILSGTNIKIPDFEAKAAQLITSPVMIKDKSIAFSIDIKKKSILARNVIGMIEGKDRSKFIVIGAHYDHLGKRNGDIYYGADDNASGSAGLLALARVWKESGIQPPCNLIFASWTAEEKGMLGSRYFAQSIKNQQGKIVLYLNMDMISGSEKQDTAGRMLSIGTRPVDKHLRDIAIEANSKLSRKFNLDLWDVTGHSGSDYASFNGINVPVMTFNSGLHDYYHTTDDNSSKTDLKKMMNILLLVNNCLQGFMYNIQDM